MHRVKSLRTTIYTCEHCGFGYNQLHLHYGKHPDCRVPELVEEEVDSEDEELEEYAEPSALVTTVLRDTLREEVANDLSDLRFEHGNTNSAVAFLKTAVTGWLDGAIKEQVKNIVPLLKDDVPLGVVQERLKIKLFTGLETQKKEQAHMKRGTPYIEPRVVDVGVKDHVVSFDVGELITRKLQHDPECARALPLLARPHTPRFMCV